jgi:tRNA threonylcarbamoyladenosine biosynthesis protein TsaE
LKWGSDELKAFLEGVGYNVAIVEIEVNEDSRTYRIII